MHNDDFASYDHYRVGNSKLHTANAISLQTLLSHGAAANQTHWKRHWGGSQYSYSFGSKIYFGSENPFWILNSIFFFNQDLFWIRNPLWIINPFWIRNPRFNFWIRNFDFKLEIHFGSENSFWIRNPFWIKIHFEP